MKERLQVEMEWKELEYLKKLNENKTNEQRNIESRELEKILSFDRATWDEARAKSKIKWAEEEKFRREKHIEKERFLNRQLMQKK